MESKLMDLSFDEFLRILRSRGQGERAVDLERRVLAGLVPPLTREQVLEASVGTVTLSLQFMSEVAMLEALQPHGVRARIEDLKAQGFDVIMGENHAR